ncbi:MAG: hypothetical protein JWM48_2817 [Mycobacterium sp.]|nr:hypothetical protein [Mycobacterium sp.]
MSAPRPRRRVVALACVALGLLATAGSGCGLDAPRSSRYTTGRCAVVLPVARDVVGGHGALLGVRPYSIRNGLPLLVEPGPGEPTAPSPGATPTPSPTSPSSVRACLVGYRGPYPPGSLAGYPQATGRYVLMVISTTHPRVLRLRAVDELPPGIGLG